MLAQDGLEFTFALNHMAYFVLTEGLREWLLALETSAHHQHGFHRASGRHLRLDFDDLQSAKNFGAMKAYVARN